MQTNEISIDPEHPQLVDIVAQVYPIIGNLQPSVRIQQIISHQYFIFTLLYILSFTSKVVIIKQCPLINSSWNI